MPIKDKIKRKAARRSYYLSHREFEIKSALRRKALNRAIRLHAVWRKSHILRCADYRLGECCVCCHAPDSLMLDIIDLPNDRFAYVCCAKIRANWKALGYVVPPAYLRGVR